MSLKRCATCGDDYDSFGREIDNTECNKCYSGFKTSKNPVWMVKCQVCKREYDCYGKPQRFTRENISIYSGDPAEPIYECDLCIEKKAEEEKELKKIEQHRKEIEKIIITTTDTVPGREIIETIGLLQEKMNLKEKKTKKSHERELLFRLKNQAFEIGADAIIGYSHREQLGYSFGFATDEILIGTAVRLKDKS